MILNLRRRWWRTFGWIGVLALLESGCAPSSGRREAPPAPPPDAPASSSAKSSATDVPPISGADACASQLHEIAGALLLYYARNDRLPKELAELSLPAGDVPGDGDRFVCPESHRPYVYDPSGIPLPGRAGRIVVYDAVPGQSNRRWAILIEDPGRPGASIIAKVISLPATFQPPVPDEEGRSQAP